MMRGSLRWRLLAAGGVSVLLALAMASLGLVGLFEQHVERRLVAELEAHLRQIVDGISRDTAGQLHLARPPAEPRFREPLSGLYWQVADEPRMGSPELRSRSLWDARMQLPVDSLSRGDVHRHDIPGPGGATLLVVERTFALAPGAGGDVRAAVAVDRAEIRADGLAFGRQLLPFLGMLAAFLIGAAWVQVRVGLEPLRKLQARLASVREGAVARLGAGLPAEVSPLGAEVDHLLDARDAALRRARERAADLAHGLRTPLTVLTEDARRLRATGQVPIAEEIEAVAAGMRQHIEREMLRARAGISAQDGNNSAVVADVVRKVVAVVQRLPRGQQIAWENDVPAGLAVRMAPEDLTEILGAILENASKWAAGEVRITAAANAATQGVGIVIEDDGPGIPPEDVALAVTRGGRLDSQQPGSGLGLTIANELVEAYGGRLQLAAAAPVGLRVEFALPVARLPRV
jgi:signal transduction histidine kinase